MWISGITPSTIEEKLSTGGVNTAVNKSCQGEVIHSNSHLVHRLSTGLSTGLFTGLSTRYERCA